MSEIKMNIKTLQIIRKFSFNSWGGAETVLWNTAKKLIEKGCPSDILATSALEKVGVEQRAGVNIQRFPYSYMRLGLNDEVSKKMDLRGGNPYSMPMLKHIRANKPDILHCHSMERIAMQTKFAARRLKIPYVITLHGQQFLGDDEKFELKLLTNGTFNYSWIYDTMLWSRKYLTASSGILCSSYDQYDNMRRRFPNKIVEYFPNGVNHDKFHKDAHGREAFRNKYNISQNADMILCVSRIEHKKNQEIIIDLLKVLRNRGDNAHVVLIGTVTGDRYAEKLQRKIKMFGLEQHVTFIKGLSTDSPDLVNAYSAADCFILPSLHEPFGIVCLEAWASGIPVVASKVGGLKRLITERENGLFFENNSLNQLLEKYDLYRKSASLKTRVIESASTEIDTKYSWNIIVDKQIKFYEKVLSNYKKRK